jgi:hypothetical protein
MNAEIFAEWLKRQNYKVIHSKNAYWHDQGPRFYQAFPYHYLFNLEQEDINLLLNEEKAIGLRYFSPLDSSFGAASYHVIYKGTNYSLNSISKKARHDVRRGLGYMRVEPITFERLAEEGWVLRYETLVRQGRAKAETREKWQKLCMSASDLPGFEAWGALENGFLIGSIISFICDDCVNILYQQSRTLYLPQRVNNTLIFSFTKELLNRKDKLWIFYGLHSLDAPPSVDRFKFRMGYTFRPARQQVIFHPKISPFIGTTSYSMVKTLKKILPKSTAISKLEGLIRFYIIGKRPLENQKWPEAISKIS